MKKLDTYIIDWNKIAEGFGLSKEQTIECFNDGRMMGRIGEFLHKKSSGGERENENSSFDVTESNGIKSEVRSITKQISFAPSKETGYGRKVTSEGFKTKMDNLDRFVALDLRELKNGILYTIEITKEDVYNLPLSSNVSIKAEKFYEIYDRIKQNI
jgi:hypothetical protein